MAPTEASWVTRFLAFASHRSVASQPIDYSGRIFLMRRVIRTALVFPTINLSGRGDAGGIRCVLIHRRAPLSKPPTGGAPKLPSTQRTVET
jgi:hypothetical protein